MKKKTLIAGSAALLLTAGAYFVLDTRLGVHLVVDVLGGGETTDYDPATGPLQLTGTLEPIDTIPLPPNIQQPSGIQHRGDTVYLSTDQAELFVGNADMTAWPQKTDLIAGPLLLKQGSLEGIEYSDDTLYAIGEFGAIRAWSRTGQGWHHAEDLPLPDSIADMEFSGMTQFDGRRLATTEDRPVIVDLITGDIHELDTTNLAKPDADLTALQFSGIAHEAGNLYLLTEPHTSILVVDAADYTVKAVWAITPGPAADLAVRDGKAYVVVDHNYLDEKPPIYVYELPEDTSEIVTE
ncbi:MAG: hypothetical protein AAGB26_04055 [Planctomycetota bacterium]